MLQWEATLEVYLGDGSHLKFDIVAFKITSIFCYFSLFGADLSSIPQLELFLVKLICWNEPWSNFYTIGFYETLYK